MLSKLRIATILGTRPEIIRLSKLIKLLDEHTDHTLIHTGQNFDAQLSEVFFQDLDIRQPDFFLNSHRDSLGGTLSAVFDQVEQVLVSVKPQAVMILGDTNSALVAILIRRMGIPVFHMEAGNRSFDESVPEEINRRMIDHVSNFNLPYSEFARENLIREGVHPNTICKTGSPMPEVLTSIKPQLEACDALQRLGVKTGGYFLISSHRQETVNDPAKLRLIVDSMGLLAADSKLPVLVSAHPRFRSMLDRFSIDPPAGVRLCEPFGYVDYLCLQANAKCVLSDSGTISEESSFLGFPAVTIRESFERQEASETGSMILAGLRYDSWLRAIEATLKFVPDKQPMDYSATDFSSKVYKFVLSKLSPTMTE